MSARDYALISGLPGAGKSATLAAAVRALVDAGRGLHSSTLQLNVRGLWGRGGGLGVGGWGLRGCLGGDRRYHGVFMVY